MEGDTVITREFLKSIPVNGGGGWTRHQLSLLGVAWPPVKGWKSRILGSKISADAVRRLFNGPPQVMRTASERRRNGQIKRAHAAATPMLFVEPYSQLDQEFRSITGSY